MENDKQSFDKLEELDGKLEKSHIVCKKLKAENEMNNNKLDLLSIDNENLKEQLIIKESEYNEISKKYNKIEIKSKKNQLELRNMTNEFEKVKCYQSK
jgi:hypothetical protein